MGIEICPDTPVQLHRDITSPELGYRVMQQLLSCGRRFTALVVFNDTSAIGAIRALQDLGLSVPGDVSVICFDDIKVAAFNNPRLTTIRQPLSNMGRIAAQCVLNQLNGSGRFRKQIKVEPELNVREATRAVDQGTHAGMAKQSKTTAKSGTGFASTELSQSPH